MFSFKTLAAAAFALLTAAATPSLAGSIGGSAPVGPGSTLSTMSTTTMMTNVRELSNFNHLLVDAHLKPTLNRTPAYTVFAPTNAAVNKVPAHIRERMFVENNPALRQLVNRHIVPGNVDLTQLADGATLTTLSGETLRVARAADGTLLINGVYRVEASRATANGMVYSIDSMIAPTK